MPRATALVVPVALVVALLGAAGEVARADPDPLAALLARTDAIAREVAAIRGLPLRRKIPNEVVDKDELRARLVKLSSDRKTADQLRADGLALARWGMIPLAADYRALVVDLLTEQIAGYYDPETKKLTIAKSAGDDREWAEMVLAHELDHGLQDQSFDLKKFEDLPASEGDATLARHALVEGDGIVLMIEVMLARAGSSAPWSNPSIAAKLARDMEIPGTDQLDRAPLAIREALMFPYRAGFLFVAALRRRHSWAAVDAAFKRPPRSTEQILHVDKYLADEPPIAIAISLPPALADQRYAIAESTVWGELGFALFLRSHGVPQRTAEDAAAGWGGDRAVVLARPGDDRPEHAVGLARLDWDTEVDAIEAYEAAVHALDDASVGGTVVRDDARTRWLAIDGTSSWVERRASSLVIVIGAPTPLADALAADAWTSTGVGAAKRRGKPGDHASR